MVRQRPDGGLGSGNVLAVDPDPRILQRLKSALHRNGLKVVVAPDAAAAAQKLAEQRFDLMICELTLLDLFRPDLVSLMNRYNPAGRVILGTSEPARDPAQVILERRVHDLLLKPYDQGQLRKAVSQALREARLEEENQRYMQLLESKNRELQVLNARLQELAITDPLTGLYNHGHFIKELTREFERSRRYGHPLALTIFDLDDFKAYNDTFGHLEGDELLRRMTQLMTQGVRRQDVLCRYGGEEFTLVQPETTLEAALQVAQRILTAVEAHPFGPDPEAPRQVTLSAGTAVLAESMPGPEDLVRVADGRLYRAKREGKNRVVAMEEGGVNPSPAPAPGSGAAGRSAGPFPG